MSFSYGFATDTGRVRQYNEDFLGCFDTPNGVVFVLCDGMGGHAGGALAARLAVEAVGHFFTETLEAGTPYSWLKEALEQANQAILDKAAQDTSLQNMGTTCVVALLKGQEVYYAHVGDSRLYHFRNGQLERVTKDHSLVQTLADMGVLTQVEADYHPRNNEITKALGIKEFTADVCYQPLAFEDLDVLLLCSDGLTGMLSDAQISLLLQKPESLSSKAKQLISEANKAGGTDNISVQLIGWQWSYATEEGTAIVRTRPRKWLWSLLLLGVLATLMAVLGYLQNMTDKTDLPAERLPQETTISNAEIIQTEVPPVVLQPDTQTSVVGEQYLFFKHTANANDSLEGLAHRYNVAKDLIVRFNNHVYFDSIPAKTKINVPVRAIHVIESGQIMDTIEKLYSIDRSLVMRANGKHKPKLLLGDTIVIPMGAK
ncbi:Serine/threonine protein phosphatase PrpC [Flexibacter flexilis DSM 6793]|uniref:Serine/threonine protein phosphatase PrpC n=1 Tax=Flexibacter flexilis DSM 6793 TaxID=927664 RepID=A0A1I1DT17_9BACT|nr:Stp1/IreP family PP2C-type Ser/Thr phosphatase [Flexibacter flexilis]SFB78004.1 Serine/threonine protein phosphatase PrpC [Flexibacter flexilis DSM 6793]